MRGKSPGHWLDGIAVPRPSKRGVHLLKALSDSYKSDSDRLYRTSPSAWPPSSAGAMPLSALLAFPPSLRYVLLATLLLVPHLAGAASVCVMRSGERMLLVQDATSRWQLPGGTSEQGELPWHTATRETLEETGLAVATAHLLEDKAGVHVFACRALKPVQVQGNAVNLLGAPHLGREIIQARWVSRDGARQLRTRFPQQLERAYQRLHAVAESEVRPVTRFGPASAFRQAEVDRVQRTQQWPVRGLAVFGNVLGEFWFYLLAMPILSVAFGAQATRLMLMALMAVTLAVQAIKVVFPVPRPFSFDAALSLAGAAGPSMPSGHTTSATCFFVLAALWLLARQRITGRLMRAGIVGIALLAGVVAGMARVWLGVHYWSDVAAGLLLGSAVAAVIHALSVWLAHREHPAVHERICWASIATVSLVVGVAWQAVPLLLPFCVALACAVVPRAAFDRSSIGSAALLLAGLLVLGGLCLPMAQRAEPFVLAASLQALVYMGLGAWVAWGASAVSAWLPLQPGHQSPH
ncbi:bifunctional NUDIX hydrolase/phosphatase PAP2 family protein [Stenotrophomonas sp. RAC2]|uniref:bifunctional NUDIX hydrolase/phosphatase PAP2 family protein n=1 Tax=Stenotrophomonas sp. RAC2 TaxID=3064902 RepID=UPI002723A858|nr:bifunctional NUDIX hydrolase/phosphatase PAP2 family protein [Stenotrophomonas sp. RAC2]MDV9043871.1 bifunctional NUDIX hydrolase/phosphatase PAP2 family protein [Stenotrophomonas sp. RAC2]